MSSGGGRGGMPLADAAAGTAKRRPGSKLGQMRFMQRAAQKATAAAWSVQVLPVHCKSAGRFAAIGAAAFAAYVHAPSNDLNWSPDIVDNLCAGGTGPCAVDGSCWR